MSKEIKIKVGSMLFKTLLGAFSLIMSIVFGFKSMWMFFGLCLTCSQIFILTGFFERQEKIIEKRFELLEDIIITQSSKKEK